VWLVFAGALLAGVVFGLTSGFGLPFITSEAFPKIFEEGLQSPRALLLAIAVLPAVFLLRGLADFANVYGMAYCGLHVLRRIQLRVFEKLQQLPLEFFHRNSTGDLMSRVIVDSAVLKDILTTTANSIVKEPITLASAMGALFYLSWKHDQMVFVVFCLALVPILLLMMRFTGRNLQARARQMQRQSGILAARVQENVAAAKEIRTFTLEESELTRLREALDLFVNLQLKVVKYANLLRPTMEFCAMLGAGVAIFYAARTGMTLEQLLPLVVALIMSFRPGRAIGTIHNQLKQGSAALDRLEQILHTEDTIPEPAAPVSIEGVRGKVEFRGVSFDYVGAPVLHDIDETIEPGEIVALVGPSGAGKSTFANLIPRLYDVRRGAVLVDGHDVRSLRKKELRSHVAIVPQEPMLFNDSVRNNILLGRVGATGREVEAAARAAYAHDFIEAMPDSYDTMVGDRGVRLSGGERQRIALARAFLKDAPILILDEATSALDSESEWKVQQALEQLVRGRTTFIIAHRFSTLKIAHRVLVFEAGRIVGRGPHDSLYASSVVYRGLCDRQRQ
jgi:subfamily B ATP-binding cassette protein MsbA